MKKVILSIFSLIASLGATASEIDSLNRYNLNEIVVRSSTKETSDLRKNPLASTLFTPKAIDELGIESVKDLGMFVPGLYTPAYGSKLSTPIYFRGVGARSGQPSIGFYVNNVPYLDKSSIDFELMDIKRIEVLRGPQGTLYGRNAMSGIFNIYTLSPLEYQGTKLTIGGGNYGLFKVNGSNYSKVAKNAGLAIGGYYNRTDGYYRNETTGKRVDNGESAGGRIKFDWQINDRLLANIESSFDYTNQGAFAYGLYDAESETIANPNYNDEGSYKRIMSNNSLRFSYTTDKVMISSTSGYQYLDDDMMMDQDFSPASLYTVNQCQNIHSFSQEFAIKSRTKSRYQHSSGVFGFYNGQTTTGDIVFKKDGVAFLQSMFSGLSASDEMPYNIKITNEQILNPGTYETPSYGLALFHQSTLNDIFTDGLSLTVGARLDYEKQWLNYDTNLSMNLLLSPKSNAPHRPELNKSLETPIKGELNQDFVKFLPKVALKYECSDNVMTYITVAKGYKTGGYNYQMFADVAQSSIGKAAMGMMSPNPNNDYITVSPEQVSYKPETSWNYELGVKSTLWDGKADIDLALYYMTVKDLQLTQYTTSGTGRILSNAGEARSIGGEISIRADVARNFDLIANYGFTDAQFTKYSEMGKDGSAIDYAGNYVPYSPKNTIAISALYDIYFKSETFKKMSLTASYEGAGKIYWTEENDAVQPYYGLLSAKASLETSWGVDFELWARNIAGKEYGAFYFSSMGRTLLQPGNPFTIGANLVLEF